MVDERDAALSLAYMRVHPVQAARVLEGLSPEDAGALFERVPARIGATVLAAMLPQWAARCLRTLDDGRALELLAPMGTQPAVALLRHMPDARRRVLVAGLPTAIALASTLLLGYGQDTLGAWADPDIVVLPHDTRAGQALLHLRESVSPHSTVFVADAARRLGGTVSLANLLQAPEAATLASLMARPVALLAAHAPLAAAAAHPGWELASALPVVEPGDRLIGLMTHDAMARALRRAGTTNHDSPEDGSGALPPLFARGYWQVLSGLFAATLSLLPGVPQLGPEQEPADGR